MEKHTVLVFLLQMQQPYRTQKNAFSKMLVVLFKFSTDRGTVRTKLKFYCFNEC